MRICKQAVLWYMSVTKEQEEVKVNLYLREVSVGSHLVSVSGVGQLPKPKFLLSCEGLQAVVLQLSITFEIQNTCDFFS